MKLNNGVFFNKFCFFGKKNNIIPKKNEL